MNTTENKRLKEQLRIAIEALRWYENEAFMSHKDMKIRLEHVDYLSGLMATKALKEIKSIDEKEDQIRGISLKEHLNAKNS